MGSLILAAVAGLVVGIVGALLVVSVAWRRYGAKIVAAMSPAVTGERVPEVTTLDTLEAAALAFGRARRAVRGLYPSDPVLAERLNLLGVLTTNLLHAAQAHASYVDTLLGPLIGQEVARG